MNVQWYVLRSKPNKEMALWGELTARGYECFYPRLHVHPVDARSRKIRPYFPGYLFLQTDLEVVGLSTFQWMPFSSGLLTFGGIPATVPHSIVQAIGRHIELINEARAELLAGIKRGEPVIIQEGPFEGYEAIFDVRLPGSERVRVLLKLLSDRHVNLVLPASQVKRLPRKPR